MSGRTGSELQELVLVMALLFFLETSQCDMAVLANESPSPKAT